MNHMMKSWDETAELLIGAEVKESKVENNGTSAGGVR